MVFRGRGDKETVNVDYLECKDKSTTLCVKLANLAIEQCFGLNGLLLRLDLRILRVNAYSISCSKAKKEYI